MINESAPGGFAGFIEQIKKWAAPFVAITAFVFGLRLVFKEAQENIIWAVLAIASLGWLFLFWVYTSKKDSEIWEAVDKQPKIEKLPQYPKWRKWALVGMIFLPVLTISGLAVADYLERRPSNKTIILIANFQGSDQKFAVTQTVINRMKRATREFPEVQIKHLDNEIKEGTESEAVKEIGARHKASIIIWGFYDEALDGTVHIELIHSPGVISLHRNEFDFNVALSEKQGITIKEGLSGDLGLLTLFVAGLARYVVKDFDGAILRFSKALEQHATSQSIDYVPDILSFRGNAFLSKGDAKQAIDDYTRAISLKPNQADIYTNLGSAYDKQGDLDRAITEYTHAISLDPNNACAYLNRGATYIEKGSPERGEADLDHAISLKPNDPASYVNRGGARMKRGNYSQAIMDYDRAITLRPNFVEAYVMRGTLYHLSGHSEKGKDDLDRAIALNPQSAMSYVNRGLIYDDNKDYDRAIADYTRAITLKPDFLAAYYNRASSYSSKFDYARAINDLNYVLSINSKYTDAYVKRGAMYFKIENYDRAEADLDSAIALKPTVSLPYFIRGYLYERKGNIADAIAKYQTAYKLANSSSDRASLLMALNNLGAKPN